MNRLILISILFFSILGVAQAADNVVSRTRMTDEDGNTFVRVVVDRDGVLTAFDLEDNDEVWRGWGGDNVWLGRHGWGHHGHRWGHHGGWGHGGGSNHHGGGDHHGHHGHH